MYFSHVAPKFDAHTQQSDRSTIKSQSNHTHSDTHTHTTLLVYRQSTFALSRFQASAHVLFSLIALCIPPHTSSALLIEPSGQTPCYTSQAGTSDVRLRRIAHEAPRRRLTAPPQRAAPPPTCGWCAADHTVDEERGINAVS